MWKETKLGEIFTEEELEKIASYLNLKDLSGLKSYLRSLSTQLQSKGVLPDYMYYYFEYLHMKGVFPYKKERRK